MTRLAFSRRALADIDRLCDFLLENLPHEAARTAEVIASGLEVLKQHPEMGRPVEQGLRELVISRGRSGYLALYAFDPAADAVLVLAIRHQREVGYG